MQNQIKNYHLFDDELSWHDDESCVRVENAFETKKRYSSI